MKLTELVTTEESHQGFYPTPEKVAEKLLAGLDLRMIENVLEPSAGKGNLVETLSKEFFRKQYVRYHREFRHINVDCIEIDPYLRSILSYEFCGRRRDELVAEYSKLRGKEDFFDPETRSYGTLTEDEKQRKGELDYEILRLRHTDCHIVHDDFLTFDSRKNYDLILMNPPFSSGDEHLLKAIEMQSRSGGEIRCILNAETLRNPYTNRRRHLANKLRELGADVAYMAGAFNDAERSTSVDIAIIKLSVPVPKYNSAIYDRLRKAAEVDETPVDDVTDLTVSDFMERIVSQYNVEVDAGLALIREYKAMQPYIMSGFSTDKYASPNLSLCVGTLDRSGVLSENKFIHLTRKKYWEALFTNKEFVGKLTSNLREKYRKMVDSMAAYDFTLFNIQQVMVQMNAEMGQGIQDTIVKLFDKMTEAHSWYPECLRNVHYFDGWKTNKVHKINSKVILPVNGMFSSYSWDKDKSFNLQNAENTISDIEKVFEYLDGNMTAPVDLHGVLLQACESGQTKNIRCRFFDVTIYKKGTMHIKFRNQALVDRFNIYCCQKKGWLPPNYGRTSYSDMSKEAQDVVDGFNGDGSEGSGAAAYTEIIEHSPYYLAEPSTQVKGLLE